MVDNQNNLNILFALLFQCGALAIGPVVGFFLAKKRGVNPLLGLAVGLLGCAGWAVIFFVLGKKPISEPTNSAGRSFSAGDGGGQ